MSIRILRITATTVDYWGRQHFQDYDTDGEYCDVDGRVHTFVQEPELPVSANVSVIEVDDLGRTVRVWQE
jgi:hypothetical protein